MSDNTILTDTHGPNAPAAAKFDQGARTVAEVQKAVDARNDLSRVPAPRRDSR